MIQSEVDLLLTAIQKKGYTTRLIELLDKKFDVLIFSNDTSRGEICFGGNNCISYFKDTKATGTQTESSDSIPLPKLLKRINA
jgi:hypothetical protein